MFALVGRRSLGAAALCAGWWFGWAANVGAQPADAFPERPITLICPWTPGGNTDIALRALADVAARQLGKRIVIENKPGAGGALGPQYMAATAKPDGYTLSQIAGPKGMDPKVVRILHDAFRRAIDDPAFAKVLDRVGMAPYYMGGNDYMQWARRAAEEERRAVERLGLKP